jgi:DNA (cytosine-5)-methyltransferase 1
MDALDPQTFARLFPPDVDVVIGGFPCQDFSVAGKRGGFKSDRGRLYQQMKRMVELTNPRIFIAENVKGLTNLGRALEMIESDFGSSGLFGYDIDHRLHMAADFGVPQTRERVFIRGVRRDLNPRVFSWPLETHNADPEDSGLPGWVTAEKAIHDLLGNISVKNQDQFSKARNYGAHLQGNKRIRADYPSPTIRAEHHGNIEFHYDEALNRRLTIRECARIQSFPDDFVFQTSPSKAYKLIGNAVPPVLAWHIAKSVAAALTKWEMNAQGSSDNISNYVGDKVEGYDTRAGAGSVDLVARP